MKKQRWRGSEKRREEKEKEDQRRERVRRRCRRAKVRKTGITLFCPVVESRLAKAAAAEPCGQMRNENWHAAVALKRISEHFLKLGCRKRACDCGSERFWKMTKLLTKCTASWREALFQIKMRKAHQHRSTFGS